jgi:inner membrane protein
MLLLGHLGTTLGAVSLIEKFFGSVHKNRLKVPIDYRLVMIGSLLPDLIDKPLVLLTATKPVGAAKSIAHSLVFIMVVLLLGELYEIICKRRGLIWIVLASFAHLVEDAIWRQPKIFLWPYYNWFVENSKLSQPTVGGVDINKRVEIITESVTKVDLKHHLLKPDILIPEIIGGLILIYFFLKLIRNKNLIGFLKTGLITRSHLNT